jgi:hypothetical protein
MKRTDRRTILDIAARQHGVFNLMQANESGLTAEAVDHWAASGEVRRLDRGVWAVVGAPATPDRLAMASVLRGGPGSALCRASAGWLWGLARHQLAPVELMRDRGDRQTRTSRVRSSRVFTGVDVTTRRGIPVTTPARTIFDLAAKQQAERTRKDLNDLFACGLVNLELLNESLERLAARGRPGIAVMRRLIRELEEKGAPAGSSLELLAEEILVGVGFEGLVRQLPIYDREGFIARVDFAEPLLRVAFEVDSDRFHLGLVDRMLDERKTRRLVAIEWTVVRISERELWWERPGLERRLRQVRSRVIGRSHSPA